MKRPVISANATSPSSSPLPDALPLYKKACMAGKILGLAGFWAADNVVFLCKGTPFLHPTEPGRRKSLAKRAYDIGARAYFCGAVFHLVQSAVDLRRAMREVREERKRARETGGVGYLQIKTLGLFSSVFLTHPIGAYLSLCESLPLFRSFRLARGARVMGTGGG